MSEQEHPYQGLPAKAFWKRAVARLAPAEVDPVGQFDLRIGVDTKVATAGSCFAQHIARHLRGAGFHYYVAEPGHPILPNSVRSRHQYGTFSARFGNIYTARQLRQLIDRCEGVYQPAEDVWHNKEGKVVDPFRPAVQPGGFLNEAEMRVDRAQHMAAVARMFRELDVFVFTLGLTEYWESRIDGAAFPVCPGVEAGAFDPQRHQFHNQDVGEVTGDMVYFLDRLRAINPDAQVVLTVSPVPLMATADPGQHVLCATTYSKSVLRVAAETLRRQYAHVHYFPSYEIITGNFNRGKYYASDLRGVLEDGVSHVMRLFLLHATGQTAAAPAATDSQKAPRDAFLAQAEAMIDVECDESALDRT